MSLLQINDIRSKKQELESQDKEVAIGIDLGTSNSVVTCYIDDKVVVIPDDGGNLVPSLVCYLKDKIVVGNEAKRLLGKENVFKSIKRLMGKSFKDIDLNEYNFDFSDIQSDHVIKLSALKNKDVTPEEVSSEILRKLKSQAEDYLKQEVKQAVITVPAYFDEGARVATKNAARLANLEVLRLINEPTSAALAYGLDKSVEGVYVIYDLGGGTFDVSILRLDKGIFKVLATSGDTSLGGDDIDNLILVKILESIKIDWLSNIERASLLDIAKDIKEELSDFERVEKEIEFRGQSNSFKLTREDFNNSIKNLIEKTINICDLVLDDSECTLKDIKGVVLVGGSTRIPYLRDKVGDFFGVEPLCDINPDEVVAIGAGYQAAMLSGNSMDSLLLDVIPLSLGIEIAGGMVEKIIPRNSLIPITKKQEFTTFKDGQTSMLIHVLQGERELVEDLRSLGKFTLKGIPPMVAGAGRIVVTFSLDADGLLSVEAQEKFTGVKQSIAIKPSWGLSFEDMREMIESSMIEAESDITKRLLIASKIDAERLIDVVKVALRDDKHLILEEVVDKITVILSKLEDSLKGDSRELVDNLSKELEIATIDLAELRMNEKIKNMLSGKAVEEIEEKIKR